MKTEIEQKDALLKKQSDEIEALRVENKRVEDDKMLLEKVVDALKLEMEGEKNEEKKETPVKYTRKLVSKKIGKKTMKKKLPPNKARSKDTEGASIQLELEKEIEELEVTVDLLIERKDASEKEMEEIKKLKELKEKEFKDIVRKKEEKIKDLTSVCNNMKKEIEEQRKKIGQTKPGSTVAAARTSK